MAKRREGSDIRENIVVDRVGLFWGYLGFERDDGWDIDDRAVCIVQAALVCLARARRVGVLYARALEDLAYGKHRVIL